jgi:hypothetical protein
MHIDHVPFGFKQPELFFHQFTPCEENQSNYWDALMGDLIDAKEMIWISSTSLNIRSVHLLEKTLGQRNHEVKNQVLLINKKGSRKI